MGLYALDGGVVGAVSGAALGVVGEGGGCLAGDKGEQEQEEGDGGDSKQDAVFTHEEVEITQSRCKRVRFHFVRWLGVG